MRIPKNINLQVRGRLADMFTIQKEKERLLFAELTRQSIKENRPSETLAKWAFADFKPRGPASFIPNLRKRVSIIPCNYPRHENYSTACQSSFYVKRERLFHEIHRDRQTSAETSAFLLDGEDLKKWKVVKRILFYSPCRYLKEPKTRYSPHSIGTSLTRFYKRYPPLFFKLSNSPFMQYVEFSRSNFSKQFHMLLFPCLYQAYSGHLHIVCDWWFYRKIPADKYHGTLHRMPKFRPSQMLFLRRCLYLTFSAKRALPTKRILPGQGE